MFEKGLKNIVMSILIIGNLGGNTNKLHYYYIIIINYTDNVTWEDKHIKAK